MKEILWLGRGGQGAFTAAKLFGAAYISDAQSQYALAFPSFGPERRGAKPVEAKRQNHHQFQSADPRYLYI